MTTAALQEKVAKKLAARGAAADTVSRAAADIVKKVRTCLPICLPAPI
jgi:hypothetical protein